MSCLQTSRRIRREDGGRRAFTLVELITVIAIVAVLGALLSTALNQAKGRAHQISCLNNLRQLHHAWTFYVDDNENRLPLNRSVPSVNEKLLGRRNTPDSWVAGNPREDTSTQNIERGTLFRFKYVDSPTVFRCPADTAKVMVDKSIRRTRSYSMSAYLNGDDAGSDPRVKVKLAEVEAQPAHKIFVFIEEDSASPSLGSFQVMSQDASALASASFSSVPGAWHNRGCDLSFADGHVEYLRWQASKKAGKASSSTLPRSGLQSFRRLQEAVPKP